MNNEYKRDCFAFGRKGCGALKQTQCVDCRFYKTAEQLAEEQERCQQRLEENGGIPGKYLKRGGVNK